jgi:hypothetical protein
MKTRTGFVSNSSSSSFLLDLRDPETKEFFDFFEKYVQLDYDSKVKKGTEAKESNSFYDDLDGEELGAAGKMARETPAEFLVEIEIDNGCGIYFKFPKNVVRAF